MRDALFARRHLLDVLLAAAIGYALFRAAESLSHLWLDVMAQHVADVSEFAAEGDSVLGLLNLFSAGQGPHLLKFTVGGTLVPYGLVLAPLSTLVLVAMAAVLVRRLQRRCPHCRSVVRRDASVCASCSLEVGADPR